jgi:hypothetical protein
LTGDQVKKNKKLINYNLLELPGNGGYCFM